MNNATINTVGIQAAGDIIASNATTVTNSQIRAQKDIFLNQDAEVNDMSNLNATKEFRVH